MTMEKFVGTWKLVSYEARLEDGTVLYPMGKDAIGTLIYTDTGYMSGHLSRADIDKSSFDQNNVETKVVIHISNHLSYTGKFQVDESKVTHHIEICVFPSWVGSDQERFYKFTSDRLILSTGIYNLDGVRQSSHLIWKIVS